MSLPKCNICQKDCDARISATALLLCEMGHTETVHQRCFEKAIDKAIRVRSTRSTSFENIARSTTHSWKTQKCTLPGCIKWLSEYTQNGATDPAAAAAAMAAKNEPRLVFRPRPVEEEEEEEEEPDRCVAVKVDATRCNFKVSNEELKMCRRCSEKHLKQEKLKAMFVEKEAEAEEALSLERAVAASGSGAEDKKEEKKKKSKIAKSAAGTGGLNSMLKSLAKVRRFPPLPCKPAAQRCSRQRPHRPRCLCGVRTRAAHAAAPQDGGGEQGQDGAGRRAVGFIV